MLNNIDQYTPKQFKSSYIKLIPKHNNNNKTINDYRPITVINYEYRIFAKVILKRLRNFNDLIFDEQQNCSIKTYWEKSCIVRAYADDVGGKY